MSTNSKSVDGERKEEISPLQDEENGEEGADEKTKRKQIQYVMQVLSNKVLEDARQHEERHYATAKEREALRAQIAALSEEKDNLERELLAKADEVQR